MDALCPRCGAGNTRSAFCSECGKLLDRVTLESIRLPGEIGVQKLEQFWQTGDPRLAVKAP